MTRNENTITFSRPNLNKKVRNKTTLFMLPALNLSETKFTFELLRYFGFVNCYIDHTQSLIKPPDSIYMVFNPSKEAIKSFNKLFDIYKNYPNFVTDYIVDRNLIVVVFKVKDKWRSSYKEFKNSRYSLMSKDYAEQFKRPDIATGRVHTTREYFVIHKHQDYRTHLETSLEVKIDKNAELMDPLDPKKEVFDYEPISRESEREPIEIQSWQGECQA